jgi:uncharacterized protein YegL
VNFACVLATHLQKKKTMAQNSIFQGMDVEQYRPEIAPGNITGANMALLFLLDTSASMTVDNRIQSLNAGMNRFKQEVLNDQRTREILQVAIMRFDADHSLLQDFRPIADMMELNLSATGAATNYSPAVRDALKFINGQARYLERNSGIPYKPWIIMITDGEPTEPDINIVEVAKEVRERVAMQKVSFRSLAVGDCDSTALHTLSDVVLRLGGTDFTSFFNWVNKSMYNVGVSTPGQTVAEANLTGNVGVDQNMQKFAGL